MGLVFMDLYGFIGMLFSVVKKSFVDVIVILYVLHISIIFNFSFKKYLFQKFLHFKVAFSHTLHRVESFLLKVLKTALNRSCVVAGLFGLSFSFVEHID